MSGLPRTRYLCRWKRESVCMYLQRGLRRGWIRQMQRLPIGQICRASPEMLDRAFSLICQLRCSHARISIGTPRIGFCALRAFARKCFKGIIYLAFVHGRRRPVGKWSRQPCRHSVSVGRITHVEYRHKRCIHYCSRHANTTRTFMGTVSQFRKFFG